MLAVGSSACALVVVTAVEDTEAIEGVLVDSVVTLEGAGVDLLVLTTAESWDVWTVGPCAWGPVGVAGLAVELSGVCSEGLCVLVGLLTFAVVAAAV